MTIATFEHAEPISTSKPRSPKRRKNAAIPNRGLPEYASYRDTGCELAPSCLECPLAICKYDDPHWGKRNLKARRNEEIVDMRARGMSVAQIATEVNTSERTVYRVIQRDYYSKLATSKVA